MTNYEAEALSKVLTGVAHVGVGMGHVMAGQQGIELKKQALEEKQLNDYKENLRKKAPKRTNPDTGAVEFNEKPVLAEEFANNRKNIPAKLLPDAEAAWRNRQQGRVKALDLNKGTKLTPAQIIKQHDKEWASQY